MNITFSLIEPALAWNVRGDPARPEFAAAVLRTLGVELPLTPNTVASGDEAAMLWLGPRSWLLVSTSSERDDFDAARIALSAAGGALFDVSASYVGWTMAGPAAARVLSRMCPLDFHPRAFDESRCAQSVLGHVGALYWRLRDARGFNVLVARSFAADAWHALCTAAATEGYRATADAPAGRAT
jgi:sarcosine oxidase subunit gamma